MKRSASAANNSSKPMRYLIMLFAAVTLAACNRGKQTMLPDSGGRPYEVVVIGDSDSILYKVLSAPVGSLPQPEPSFDVSMGAAMNATLRLARNIVVVETNAKLNQIKVKYERNVYAEPQLIVRISTPSTAALKNAMQLQKAADNIRNLIKRNEMNNALMRLEHKHNTKLEAEVRRMFGIDMRIPADMQASRNGKDFIWISNDSPTAMTNICIYTSENRDSVMQTNIKGETDDMYMTTVEGSVVTTELTVDKSVRTVRRGLWEMHGDAMGGPFVQHIIKRSDKQRTIVAEAFVFAPGTKKRNLLLNTEAALYTIQPKQNNKWKTEKSAWQ